MSPLLQPVRRRRRDRRGSVGALSAMMFAVLAGIGAWSLNQAHLHYQGVLQRQTVQAAALAAAAKLSTYYTTNAATQIVAAAQSFATANMPTASYGNVLPAGNVVLGNWNATTGSFTSLAASGGTMPNAVSITGLRTATNGNPVPTLLPGIVGRASFDYITTAIASFGTGHTFNTIITNDLSNSFSPSIAHQRAADNAILACLRDNAGTASRFGITTHTGYSAIFQELSTASQNFTTLQAKIATLKSCGNPGAPACSGSNQASAIYSAIQQFRNPIYNNTRKNLVIITDGVPNANSRTYTREDGIYPTPTSTSPTCTTSCTDNNLWTMAQNQAAQARAEGISITTIYYSGNTSSSQRASYAAKLASLTGGTGVALVAPTEARISEVFAGFCATMSSALKAVY